jgi:DNA-3-methyladenine glycosylase I
MNKILFCDPDKPRCSWPGSDPLYIAYHDLEWGFPVHDDVKLFESLILDGFQAGLSWLTILRKRDHFREAFYGFDPKHVAAFTECDVQRLLGNPGIVRNKLKIRSAISNARVMLDIQAEFGSFDQYLWQFTNGKTIVTHPRAGTVKDIPTRSSESDVLSADLRKRGFKFCGTTIVYAFMQACGLVDDHMENCFRVTKT